MDLYWTDAQKEAFVTGWESAENKFTSLAAMSLWTVEAFIASADISDLDVGKVTSGTLQTDTTISIGELDAGGVSANTILIDGPNKRIVIKD